ncbi:hypothetical protein KIPB_002933 [Kipferlia bialata]|uniref:Uncharacterized protein n=1 Tax=Kipferlia bialata TaxID=797122 RepID=A0A9K3CSM0_9EUKA|nr:hypothetical protein KIPB_002933 [Kipferlia bialata]|eukprot:g2933.t1
MAASVHLLFSPLLTLGLQSDVDKREIAKVLLAALHLTIGTPSRTSWNACTCIVHSIYDVLRTMEATAAEAVLSEIDMMNLPGSASRVHKERHLLMLVETGASQEAMSLLSTFESMKRSQPRGGFDGPSQRRRF